MIDFSNTSILVNQGQAIPIDTQAEYDAVLNACKQVYEARPGGHFDGDALGDMENRIRGGQTLEQIVAAAYDDAARRFPATQAQDTISRDAQSGLGAQYVPTTSQVQQIITSAGITAQTAAAAAIPSRSVAEIVGGSATRTLSTQTVRPTSAGPMTAGMFGGGALPGGSIGGMSFGTILMLAGGALVLFMLLKGHKKGRAHG
jgi:hypothetical protein